jgi:Lon protease-like protein
VGCAAEVAQLIETTEDGRMNILMASTIAFEPSEKQKLLELRGEDERLELLARLCATALGNLTRSQEAAQRASTNGKVRR